MSARKLSRKHSELMRFLRRLNWANVLTAARLVLILPITLAVALGSLWWTVGLYCAAALTDLFDGIVARSYGFASQQGARLDGSVDMAFMLMTLAWLYVVFPSELGLVAWAMIALVASALLTAAVSLFLHRRLISVHPRLGRVGAAALFVAFPLALLTGAPSLVLVAIPLLLAGRVEAALELHAMHEKAHPGKGH